ncbi:carboxymuconolactone decarboxylase family protein [Enemella evansiae]|uniref:carboxymuconolactone decarboxylase family protein n=1 Tax=Enemella evansiae TaxID=2016499 RepID=UPI000B961E31|nr:carboxymuconolactone decarboxylase family protein [Enemella evansiae]OYO07731.1 4-carboxymuconolactone decarboxylase [Enemella evansiae]TDO85993.1 AhpD family alkylhydroperoxidase [Enemella evansiae]
MTNRINIHKTNKLGIAAVLGMEAYNRRGMDAGLKELVVLRASLLNDCRYCIAMHRRDATKRGETAERLDAVADWPQHRELFTPAEQLALEFTDAVTRIHGEESVPDELYDRVQATFGEAGTGHLLLTIATINVWNRLAISTRMDPATLKP